MLSAARHFSNGSLVKISNNWQCYESVAVWTCSIVIVCDSEVTKEVESRPAPWCGGIENETSASACQDIPCYQCFFYKMFFKLKKKKKLRIFPSQVLANLMSRCCQTHQYRLWNHNPCQQKLCNLTQFGAPSVVIPGCAVLWHLSRSHQ